MISLRNPTGPSVYFQLDLEGSLIPRPRPIHQAFPFALHMGGDVSAIDAMDGYAPAPGNITQDWIAWYRVAAVDSLTSRLSIPMTRIPWVGLPRHPAGGLISF